MEEDDDIELAEESEDMYQSEDLPEREVNRENLLKYEVFSI
jgi:hypothetical protein